MAIKATHLGEHIRHLRHKRGWSVEELAEQAGLNPLSLRKIESGERCHPRIDTMTKLADALEITLDQLADRD